MKIFTWHLVAKVNFIKFVPKYHTCVYIRCLNWETLLRQKVRGAFIKRGAVCRKPLHDRRSGDFC